MSEEPLEEISADRFRPALGQTFTISVGDDSIEATLKEVSALEGDTVRRDRSPFSLLFSGPADVSIDQQICRVENGAVGELHIFLVTLGPDLGDDERPMLYEAVFT